MEKYTLLTNEPHITGLSMRPGGHDIYMYADDGSDFGMGGNKVRFYECLIPKILEAQPEVLVSSGSMYSNHIRVTALVASRLGLKCHIMISEEEGFCETENVRLAREYGAVIHPVGHFAALLKIEEFVAELEQSGRRVYLVPNGGHTPEATRAYRDVTLNALSQLESRGVHISTIFLPCASGTTHAGVLCAGAEMTLPEVISFTVANKPKRAQKAIAALIDEAAAYNGGFYSQGLNICVLDSGKNDYGEPDAELLELRRSLYETDGIELDATYNINAFYGMIRYLEEHPGNSPVLYINTGGYTGPALGQ